MPIIFLILHEQYKKSSICKNLAVLGAHWTMRPVIHHQMAAGILQGSCLETLDKGPIYAPGLEN